MSTAATAPGDLRRAARRLTVRFTALIAVLFVIVAGIAIALLAESQQQALQQQLTNAEHLSSPLEAPPGVYVAIAGPGGPGDIIVSPSAPHGFPDMTTFQQSLSSGVPSQQTLTLGGRTYAVRTGNPLGHTVQVAVDTSTSQAELERVLLAFALAGIPALGGAAALAWWMSRRAMHPLADALALQRRFIADAGHELRTPLTLLSTRAQLLRRGLPDHDSTPVDAGAVRAGLDEVLSDARALTGILEDLLITADPRRDAERVEVDLAQSADTVVAAMRPGAVGRGVAVERTGDDPVVVIGVPVALSRAIVALASNAVDHARSRVTLAVSVRGPDAVIEVSDDGPGFAPEIADRAFERFADARAASQAATPGVAAPRHYGLGLALAAEVAARHGGAVSIDDTRDTGALVRLRVPLRPRS